MTARAIRSVIQRITRRTYSFLGYVSLDVFRKVEESLHGSKYAIAFHDDFPSKSDVMFAKSKPELFDCFKIFK